MSDKEEAKTRPVRINTRLSTTLERDAKALQMSVPQLVSMLIADALERAHSRRYSPFTLPDGYRFDHDNVRPFAPKKEHKEGQA